MARQRFRQAFDPDAGLVVLRPIKVSGRPLEVGSILDNTLFTVRTRRQLFDQRALGYAHETGRQRCMAPNPLNAAREKAATVQALRDAEALAALPPPPPPRTFAVEIPEDWKALRWPQLLSLATKFAKVRLLGKADAVAAIETELLRRAA